MTEHEINPIKYGVLWERVQQMEKKLDKMEHQLDELLALANKGRGGFWAGMTIATLYTLHPEVTDEDGTVIAEAYSTPNYANIDTLGTLYEAAPEDAGEDYVHAVLSGWHVNVRVVDEDPAPLEAFAVHPVLPRRVWA